MVSPCGFDMCFPVTNIIGCLMCIQPFVSSLEKYLFKSFACFLIGLFILIVEVLFSFLFFFLIFIFIYLCGCTRCQLRYTGSLIFVEEDFFLVAACKLLVAGYGIQFSDQGLNLGPLRWEQGISHWTTREIPRCHIIYVIQIQISYQIHDLQICSPILCVVFTFLMVSFETTVFNFDKFQFIFFFYCLHCWCLIYV